MTQEENDEQHLDMLWLNGSKKETKMRNQLSTEMTGQTGIQAQAIPLSAGDAMLGMIERLAANPDVDIVKMQALLDMRNQEFVRIDSQHQLELARIAKQEFAIDFVPMSAELPLIIKTKSNTQTHSKYAELADINQVIRPILGKYGFSISTNITNQTKESVTVVATLMHKGGHTQSIELTLPLDGAGFKGNANKTDIQAIASSISYAKRIAICALLNISTGDDKDGNANTADVFATEIQRTAIVALYKKLTEQEQDNFNERTGGLLSIQKKDVDTTIAALNNTINKRAK